MANRLAKSYVLRITPATDALFIAGLTSSTQSGTKAEPFWCAYVRHGKVC